MRRAIAVPDVPSLGIESSRETERKDDVQQTKSRVGIFRPQGRINARKSLADMPEFGLFQNFLAKTKPFCHNDIADTLSPTSRKG
jgi:hypothetical protein